MNERFRDRPEARLGRKEYNKRFERYRTNVQYIEQCFQRYGVRRVQGAPGEDTRRRAVEMIVEMQNMMGSDRLPISDHFAVVPNYYGTYKAPNENNGKEDVVFSRAENRTVYRGPKGPASGTMTYVIGLEMVIRDFRNYEFYYEPLATGNLRYLRHPTNSPLPPVEPNATAKVFDVPLGYINSFQYYPSNSTVILGLIGQYRERIKFELQINRDPRERKDSQDILEELIDDDMD